MKLRENLKNEGPFDYCDPPDTSGIITLVKKGENQTIELIPGLCVSSPIIKGLVYVGQVNDNKDPDGVGVMVASDGGILEGYWREGIPYHRFRHIKPDGTAEFIKSDPQDDNQTVGNRSESTAASTLLRSAPAVVFDSDSDENRYEDSEEEIS